jgi:hypothetical protein
LAPNVPEEVGRHRIIALKQWPPVAVAVAAASVIALQYYLRSRCSQRHTHTTKVMNRAVAATSTANFPLRSPGLLCSAGHSPPPPAPDEINESAELSFRGRRRMKRDGCVELRQENGRRHQIVTDLCLSDCSRLASHGICNFAALSISKLRIFSSSI